MKEDEITIAQTQTMTLYKKNKIEMLRASAVDAKKRAEEIAFSSGNKIGAIRSARMGVFQITPVNSYDVSAAHCWV